MKNLRFVRVLSLTPTSIIREFFSTCSTSTHLFNLKAGVLVLNGNVARVVIGCVEQHPWDYAEVNFQVD